MAHMGGSRRGGGFVIVLYCLLIYLLLTAVIQSSAVNPPTDTSTAVLIRVDQSGQGDYTKIQDAIDSIPDGNSQFVFIWIKPGVYKEKIIVPATKPYITLSGTSASDTVITWDETGEIIYSATVSVFASDFVGRYLTIQNTYGSGGKAVALRVDGDRAAFYACRILSSQDTLFDASGNHYFSNCYIEGTSDFIFGDAASIYAKCHMRYISGGTGGAITAQKRESSSGNGIFLFVGGRISAVGPGKLYLGRPWGTYSRVIYAMTYMDDVVIPQGWNDWNKKSVHSTVVYGEYNCYGPGADPSQRVDWSHQLTDAEAKEYLTTDAVGGRDWLRSPPVNFKKGFT